MVCIKLKDLGLYPELQHIAYSLLQIALSYGALTRRWWLLSLVLMLGGVADFALMLAYRSYYQESRDMIRGQRVVLISLQRGLEEQEYLNSLTKDEKVEHLLSKYREDLEKQGIFIIEDEDEE